jgi:type IV fimbrial biogenesis protein FimT
MTMPHVPPRVHSPRASVCGSISVGFTLIELLVAMGLVSILLVLAAPSFLTFQRNSELTSASNSFLASLTTARAEAMKRQLRTFVVPIDGSNWNNGWVVFVDVAGTVTDLNLISAKNTALAGSSPSTYLQLSKADGLSSKLSVVTSADSTGFVAGTVTYAMYNGSGFMTLIGGGFPTGSANSLDIYNGTDTRRIIASSSGRVRVCKPADAGCSAASFSSL